MDNVAIDIVENTETVNVTVNEVLGTDGVDGAQGPQGIPGGSYTHIEAVAANVWNINHPLGYFPNVTVIDSTDREVIGDLQYIDQNNLTITFSAAFTGKAYLS